MLVKAKYDTQVKEKLMKEFEIKNSMAVAKLEKVVLNVGFGKVAADEKSREQILHSLGRISGQKPSVRAAKKAIASFKIRQGQPVGAQVTLRGKKMLAFLPRSVT